MGLPSLGSERGRLSRASVRGSLLLGAALGGLLHEPSSCVSFSGEGWLTVPVNPAFNPHHHFSVELWVRVHGSCRPSCLLSSFMAASGAEVGGDASDLGPADGEMGATGYRLIVDEELRLLFQVPFPADSGSCRLSCAMDARLLSALALYL